MSQINSLMTQTVEEFFLAINWESKEDKLATNVVPITVSWQCLKVKEFFESNNWEGKNLTPVADTNSSFSVNLSVQEFFEFFIWEKPTEIATVAELSTIEDERYSSSQSFKIEDFAQLF
jgi:hypothetical protein